MNHNCNICNKSFKYKSILKRHLENKNKCSSNINLNTQDNNIQNNNIEQQDIKNEILKKILLNKVSKTEMIEIFMSMINNKFDVNKIINSINKIDSNINNEDNEDKDNKDNKDNENNIDNIDNEIENTKTKYNCKNCNTKFSNRQGVYKHNKLGRCKGKTETEIETVPQIIKKEVKLPSIIKTSGIKLNDILGITVNESDNTEINNTINNITNNNNPIINNNTTNNTHITNHITINAFGCESIEHITTRQFNSLFDNFSNLNKILYNLSSLVYIKNRNNMNFTKNNMNKNIVTYLDNDMEIKQISEREFIKDFQENINKLCIELFFIHKNELSLNNLIENMASFLSNNDLQDNKSNNIEIKEQLKSIMDNVYREKDINEVIKTIKTDLQNNKELKNQCINNNNIRIKKQNIRLDDYYCIPEDTNKDERNLYKVKNISLKKNIEYTKLNFDKT